jgi:predicted dehydrogenase
MVAYRLHFEEASLSAIEIAKSGALGEPKIFSSVFSHVVRAGDIRLDPKLAGGACYDLGVYCINAARNLFQSEPISVFASSIDKHGTDDTTTAILHFSGDRIAEFTVSNSAAGTSSYRIVGTQGDLRVEPAFEYVEALEHHLTIDGKTKTKSFPVRDQFAPELVYFSRCILEDKEPEPSGEEGICDVAVVEAILKSARDRRVIELPPRVRQQRPNMSQEMHKPPVGKQKPVNAPSPSAK